MPPKKAPEEAVLPLNLDKYMSRRLFNRVDGIGVEIEGGWDPDRVRTLPPNTRITRDGSVYKEAGDDGGTHRSKYPDIQFGEIPIGPYVLGNVAKGLKSYWPSMADESCGMHVHMSFAKLDHYVTLADSPAYQETVVEYFMQWAKAEAFSEGHHIWPRLKNLNEYCQKKFWPYEQISKEGPKSYDHHEYGHRYTMIHYCFQRFRTVECRILPMMKDPAQAERAVRHLVQVTNAYLLATDKKRVRETVSIPAERSSSTIRLELRNGYVCEEYEEE